MIESTKMEHYYKRLFFIGVLICFSYMLYQMAYVNPRLFKENFSEYTIVPGEFYSIARTGLGNTRPSKFTYIFKGKRFTGETYHEIPCRDSDMNDSIKSDEILYHKFPVAVSSVNPSYGLILIRKEEFDKLNLEFPDSLKFMYNEYFNCTWWEDFRVDD